MTASSYLVLASSALIFLLGLAHLVATFAGTKLFPRDDELHAKMQEISPVISDQTTMWRAWIGFNASHSMGALLFGLIYGYLALQHSELLFQSVFLSTLGAITLTLYAILAWLYWFYLPFRGILLALVLYLAAQLVYATA